VRYAEAVRKLGNLCKDQLEYQQGVKYLTQALEIVQMLDKKQSPLLFAIQNDLALLYKRSNTHFDKARELYESARTFAVDAFGMNSKAYIVYTHNLCELLETNPKYEPEALAMRQLLLKIKGKTAADE
jgi:tetratricopeptide (TPR) repeat protein